MKENLHVKICRGWLQVEASLLGTSSDTTHNSQAIGNGDSQSDEESDSDGPRSGIDDEDDEFNIARFVRHRGP